MNILAISTAFDVAQYGLLVNGKHYVTNGEVGTKHSENALVKVDELLFKAGLSVADVDVFAVNVGPGSFTGIRIGMSIIKGFMCALNKKLVAFNSLELLAYEREAQSGALLLIPASKDDYYSAVVESNGSVIKLGVTPNNEAQNCTNAVYFTGEFNIDKMLDLCELKALNGEFSNPDNLAPMYLKLSQAEKLLKAD